MACGSLLGAMALGFASPAGAVASYDAEAIGSIWLRAVTDSNGVAVDSGWAVSLTREIAESYETTDNNALASAQATFDPACSLATCPTTSVALSIDDGATSTSRSTGEAGMPAGYAGSRMWTDLTVSLVNTTQQDLRFVFDWSAQTGLSTDIGNPLTDFAGGLARVILHNELDSGQYTFFETLAQSLTPGSSQRSPSVSACEPGGAAFHPSYLLCVLVAPAATTAFQMYVDTEGEAVTEIPAPPTLPLAAVALLGVVVLRRRGRPSRVDRASASVSV